MNAMTVLMLPMLILARACSADSGDGRSGLPPGEHVDASVADGGPVGGSDPDAGAGPALATESARNGGACYDGMDNDDLGGADCADASCADAVSTCCIGSGSCCGPDGFALPAHGFDCTGTLVDECTEGRFLAFGDPDPTVRESSFIPNGNDSYDSGAFLAGAGTGVAEVFDLTTRRVTVNATITPAGGCGTTCNEVVGIALTPQTLTDTTTVRPIVGLLYSGARGTVALIVNGVPVGSQPHGEADGRVAYRLDVEPTGAVRAVRLDPDGVGGFIDTEIARATFVPIRDAKLVLHGRSRNRMALPEAVNAGLDELTVSRDVCDMPAAWVRGAEAVPTRLPDGGGSWAVENIRSISAWRHVDGVIWAAVGVGSSGGDTGIHLLRAGDLRTPDLTRVTTGPFGGNGSWDSGGVADPEIVFGDGEWHLFYTGIAADGKRRIGAATFTDTAPPRITSVDSALIDLEPGERAIEMPTVLPVDGGRWQMIARVTRDDGTQSLVRWERIERTWTRVTCGATDGAGEEPGAETTLCLRTERHAGTAGEAFDADEIAHPEIVAHNGSYQLYYAGRSGSRWAIGLLASDDLVFWRDVGEGTAILAGDAQGFDSFGVSSPAVIGVDRGVGMYYLGSDGARTRIGWAEREATTHRASELRPL